MHVHRGSYTQSYLFPYLRAKNMLLLFNDYFCLILSNAYKNDNNMAENTQNINIRGLPA